MKIKKRLFPYMLALAILLTITGLVSANISFSAPNGITDLSYNVFIENVKAENIDVISYEETNLSYVIKLDNLINNYNITFDIVNDSDFNIALNDTITNQIPDELKDIIKVKTIISQGINKYNKDNVIIEYSLKDDLTDKDILTINKYKEIKVNTIFNYNQV